MANSAGKFWGGLIVGTAIGAAVGVLFAPRSGKETRQALRKSAKDLPQIAEDLTSNVQYQAERFSEKAQQTIDEAWIRLQEAIATGQEASRRLQEDLAVSMANTASSDSVLDSDHLDEDE